jgi:hypothetical protein
VFHPPRGEVFADGRQTLLHAGVVLHKRADGSAVREHGGEVVVFSVTTACREGVFGPEAECIKERAFVRHFGHGDAA